MDTERTLQFLDLPPVCLGLIFPILTLKDIASLLQLSRSSKEIFEDPFLWREFVTQRYGSSSLGITEDYKTLAHQLCMYKSDHPPTKADEKFVFSLKKTVFFASLPSIYFVSLPIFFLVISKTSSRDIYFVHMPDYWKLDENRGDSEFGAVARLTSVCWLEVSLTRDAVPGLYDVIWRINCPTKSSINFDGKWTATPLDDQQNLLGVESLYEHQKPALFLNPFVGKGWLQVTVGRVTCPPGCKFIRLKLFGGNNYWFSDLEIDWVQLLPVNESKQSIVPYVHQEVPTAPAIPTSYEEEMISDDEAEFVPVAPLRHVRLLR